MKRKEVTLTEFMKDKTFIDAAESLGMTQDAVRKRVRAVDEGTDVRIVLDGGVPTFRTTITSTNIGKTRFAKPVFKLKS